jgi:hypothetical protein
MSGQTAENVSLDDFKVFACVYILYVYACVCMYMSWGTRMSGQTTENVSSYVVGDAHEWSNCRKCVIR